jgi:hypothetical protein
MAARKLPSKRTLAVGLIRAGMTVNDAAARLGITPNNIYRCPAYKVLLAERQKIIVDYLRLAGKQPAHGGSHD